MGKKSLSSEDVGIRDFERTRNYVDLEGKIADSGRGGGKKEWRISKPIA